MWLRLTANDVGAPALTSTDGAMCNIFDWALQLANWEIEYTGPSKRVYRPSIGNRFRMYMDNSSAISSGFQWADVRGCEDASDVNTLIDPFPTYAQRNLTSNNWMGSYIATDSIEVYYEIFVSETMVLWFPANDNRLNIDNGETFEPCMFGDLVPNYDDDDWATLCFGRTTASTSPSYGLNNGSAYNYPSGSGSAFYLARDITGFVKSSLACINSQGASSGAFMRSNCPAARAGYKNRIYRERATVNCLGSSTTSPSNLAIQARAQIPNMWLMNHYDRDTINFQDTFQDTAYNPLAEFTVFNTGGASGILVETTDTWTPLPAIGA